MGDAIRARADAHAKIGIAARLLGEQLRATRVLYAEFDDRRNVAEILGGWSVAGDRPFPAVMPLSDYDGTVLGELRGGRTVRVDHVGPLVDEPAYAAIAAVGVQALLSVPLVVDGRLQVNVSVHQSEPRHWTDDEVALVQDVAERLWADVIRARAELALRDSEARLRGVLDGMTEGFGLLAPDFTILEHNAEALRMDGRRREEIVGRNHWEVYPGSEDSELGGLLKRAMAERVPVSLEHRYAWENDRALWLDMRAYPTADGALAVFWRDVSARKQAEAERERERVFLDAVLSAMPIAAIITDATGRPVRWNRAHEELWGVHGRDPASVEPFEGYGEWNGWHHPDGTRLAPLDWPLARVIRERAATQGELIEIEPFDGRPRAVVLVVAAPVLRHADGELLGAVVVQTDVTVRLRTEQALRRADRQKDVFLATLSHELRNPLAPIRTAAELLARPGLDAMQVGWAPTVIQRQVRHMAWLLDDLLDVSRITQGKLALRRERIALEAVVDSAVEAARPLIERRSHRLAVSLPAAPVSLDADPVRLSQVLSNLLTNAAKYTEPGGRIELAVHLDAGTVALTVKDTGIGIAPDALPRVFEMFAQVQGERERDDGGLGIGLALVKGLVDLHGGTVEARSEGLGLGSTFTVRLPIAGSVQVHAPSEAAGPGAPPTRRKILVVDDNRDAADALALFLQSAGHDIRVAYEGPSALSLTQAFRPDVALLDIGMSGMNGYALARAFRAEPWGRTLTLVALTGWGRDDDRRRAAEAGFDLHLTKPVDPARIQALIAGAQPHAAERGPRD